MAEAIQDKVEVNIKKTILELTSSLEKFSDTIEKRISAVEDNLNIRINQETENTRINIRERFASQEKLACNNKEDIMKKSDSNTNSLTKTIYTCLTDTNSKISNLADKVEDFRIAEKDNSGEVIKTVIEQSNKISTLLSENHIDNEKWIDEQNEIIQDSTNKVEDMLKDASLNNAITSKEIKSNINSIVNDLQNDTVKISTNIIEQSDKIANIISEKAIHDDILNEESVKLLTSINETIISTGEAGKSVIANEADRIVQNVNENRVAQEALMNEYKISLNEVNDNIQMKIYEVEYAGKEMAKNLSDTIARGVIDEAEKTRVTLIDSQKKQVEQHYEQKKIIQNLSIQIDEKTRSVIDTNVGTSNNITTLLSEITQEDHSNIENVTERIEKKIAEASSIENDLLNDVKKLLITLYETIGNGNAKISQDFSKHIEMVISGINDVSELERQTLDAQIKKFNELNNQIASIKKYTVEKSEILSNKATEMHNELTKLLVQVLNNSDNITETANTAYDRLFNQVLDFSNTTKVSIIDLQQTLEIQKQFLENNKDDTVATMGEHLMQTQSINVKIDEYSKATEKYTSEIAARFENLQNQILNLNSLAEVLKNVSVVASAENAYQEPSLQTTSEVNPDRTEEIKDTENGVTLLKHYKANKLVSSEMVSGKKKTYDVEYDSKGQFTKSRNYGPGGEVITELEYYPNGQVKTRSEKINVNGRLQIVTSKFDEQGIKLK